MTEKPKTQNPKLKTADCRFRFLPRVELNRSCLHPIPLTLQALHVLHGKTFKKPIGYLRSEDVKRRENDKIDALATSDNALLSIVGIGESGEPHNLSKSHDKYAYGDL